MHVRIRQDLPDNQDIFAFPEERQKAQSLSLGEGPLLRYSESGKGGVDNKQNPLNPACPMECVFSFYSIGVECATHSSGAANSKSIFKANHRDSLQLERRKWNEAE